MLLTGVLVGASHAHAQRGGAADAPASVPSADASVDVASAARAFQKGQEAQLAEDPTRAAELFELADGLAPSEEALRSAIRNHRAAGHVARAASLALSAEVRYPDAPETNALAHAVLSAHADGLARVMVDCEAPCTLDLDGAVLSERAREHHDLFIVPGAHRMVARFEGVPAPTQSLALEGGERRSVSVSLPEHASSIGHEPAPAPPRVARTDEARTGEHVAAPARSAGAADGQEGGAGELDADPPHDGQSIEDGDGLPPWVAITAIALTAGAGVATTLSHLHTRDLRDDYEDAPTRDAYHRGIDSERRTHWLLAGTAGLLAGSVALAILTDWDAESPAPVGVTVSSTGAFVSLSRGF